MLIRDDKRIISDDGTQTYRAFGVNIHFHNRFFSGSFIIMFKYGHRDIDRKVDIKLKHGVSFVKVRGLDFKFFECRMVSIPKTK
jgi:hypothetical protein